jgi:hypothetical protein
MTPAPDDDTTPQRSILDYLPSSELPRLPDSTDAADLIGILNLSASYHRQCKAVFTAVAGMPQPDRSAADCRLAAEAARLGMSAASALKEAALTRLKRLEGYGDATATLYFHPPKEPAP